MEWLADAKIHPIGDAVNAWAPRAAQAWNEFKPSDQGSHLDADGTGLLYTPQGRGVRAAVWHADTLVVARVEPGTDAITFTYEEKEPDRRERSYKEMVNSDTESGGSLLRSQVVDVEYLFDWTAYLGRQSAVIVGLDPMRRDADGGRSFGFRVGRAAGVVVGTILKRVSWPTRLARDPTFGRRVAAAEAAAPHIARSYADIGPRNRGTLREAREVTVLVHGTVSTAMNLAEQLDPLDPATTLRFEHDTFETIMTNVDQLVRALTPACPKSVVLVAHSRGGLVARHAAQRLHAGSTEVRVLTYGTPYLGTPLVETAGAFWGLMQSAAAAAVRTMTDATLIGFAAGRLLRLRGLPAGIEAMFQIVTF